MAPKLAIADGALGFWQAIEEVWPQTRGQRCWVHKTANVLNKLPKSQQSKAKRALQEIWMAETKKDALAAFDVFVETWASNTTRRWNVSPRIRCAIRPLRVPAEHWKHCARPTSSKARSPPCVTAPCARRDVFRSDCARDDLLARPVRREKLASPDGHNQLPKVILGVKFSDGIEAVRSQPQAAAA